jgi:hypothetical protein
MTTIVTSSEHPNKKYPTPNERLNNTIFQKWIKFPSRFSNVKTTNITEGINAHPQITPAKN